jgi:hypothetical protein
MEPTESTAQLSTESDRAPVKVCPHCSVQATTTGAFCPNCGKPYAKRQRISKRARLIVLGFVAILLLAGAGTAVAMKVHHDNQVTAARHRREAAAEKARQLAAQRAAAERRAAAAAARERATERKFQREIRRQVVSSLEDSVSKDAKKDVADGLLDGPILRSQCDPAPGTASNTAAAYGCLAVTKENSDGTMSGYNFAATVNFNKGSYTWRLGH